jgi:3-phosphoshikimate 1-carboxyvinyltransferase
MPETDGLTGAGVDMILPGPRSRLQGSIDVPGSKSLTNRALVASAVAGGGTVRHPLDCEDTRLLAQALDSAGWQVEWGEEIRIGPRTASPSAAELWIGNSGTGARLLLALLAASPGTFVVDGTERLRQRPMGPLLDTLRRLGAQFDDRDGVLPVRIHGRNLRGGTAAIRPEVSSQFVSALLLAAPLMEAGLHLFVDGELPSSPYVELTEDVLRDFGVSIESDSGTHSWRILPGGARPTDLSIEGDWSAAAFFIAAVSAVGGRIRIGGLSPSSVQGDRAMCDVVGRGGVRIAGTDDEITIEGAVDRPIAWDLRHTPDLFPALAVVGAAAPPGSTFVGIENLRHKESDRLAAMVSNLERLGAGLEAEGSKLVVTRGLAPGAGEPKDVSAFDDHRIAMAMAVASLVSGPLRLDDPDCVQKSFPGFWERWREIAGADEGG